MKAFAFTFLSLAALVVCKQPWDDINKRLKPDNKAFFDMCVSGKVQDSYVCFQNPGDIRQRVTDYDSVVGYTTLEGHCEYASLPRHEACM